MHSHVFKCSSAPEPLEGLRARASTTRVADTNEERMKILKETCEYEHPRIHYIAPEMNEKIMEIFDHLHVAASISKLEEDGLPSHELGVRARVILIPDSIHQNYVIVQSDRKSILITRICRYI